MKRFLNFLQQNNRRVLLAYLGGGALALLALLLGALLGGTRLSLSVLLHDLVNGIYDSPEVRILFYARLPRLLASLLAGGALALSGAVLQGALGNRLASPSVIGVNAGAGFAVTLAGAIGILGGLTLSLFAFLGALLSVTLISLGAKKMGCLAWNGDLNGCCLKQHLGRRA